MFRRKLRVAPVFVKHVGFNQKRSASCLLTKILYYLSQTERQKLLYLFSYQTPPSELRLPIDNQLIRYHQDKTLPNDVSIRGTILHWVLTMDGRRFVLSRAVLKHHHSACNGVQRQILRRCQVCFVNSQFFSYFIVCRLPPYSSEMFLCIRER